MTEIWSHRCRRRHNPRWALIVVITTAASMLLVAGCDRPPRRQIQVRIATGSPTAVYYTFGRSFAAIVNRELPGVTASVLETAASAENINLVSSGDAELGFTQADALPPGVAEQGKIYSVARVYDDLLHLVTRQDEPIRRLGDLRGARVSIGPPGSGTEITANRLLQVAKLTGKVQVVQLDLDASVEALRRHEIDAFIFSGGLPVEGIAQLAGETPIRLVGLAEWTTPLRQTFGDVYVTRDVPGSVYGLDPVNTVADPNYLIVGSGLPDDVVEQLTRLLMEHREELGLAHPAAGRMSQQSAITTPPLQLSPGAARYYRTHKP